MRNKAKNTFLFLFFIFISSIAKGQTYIPESHLYGLKEGLSHRQVNDILEDKRGFIWVATASGLNRFDGYSFRVFGREDGLHSDQIEHIFEDAYGVIWVFYPKSVGAIDLIDPLSNKVFSFSEKYGDKIPSGFKDKNSKPFLTKDGALYWAMPNGFITFNPISGYHSVVIQSLKLGSSSTFSLNFVSAQQTVWGIFRGNKTTGVFNKFSNMPQSDEKEVHNFWYGLAADKSGNIFSGGELSLTHLTIKDALRQEEIAKNIYVQWVIYSDAQQRLWIGTYKNGLSVYDLATKQVISFTQYNVFDELKSAGIVSIQADKEGQIWLCATTGFYKLDFEKGILERHWSGGKGAAYLSYDNIYHFYEDKDGGFWLATGGGGLIRWDRKNNQTQQYSRKAGLPNNTIYAIYEDEHEHLWLPSDYGIIQFDKKRGQVRRVYLTEDGITNPEFNRISHYRGADGTLYFGGLNGITAFNPKDFYEKEGTLNLPLVVTNFQQFDGNSNQLIDKTGDLLANNEITLNPNDRFFNLEFALLSFNQSDKIQYAYKIDGVDANWNYQNEPRLRISRLPYGTHILHIRGQAANGLWGSNELTIKVNVWRPFYLQIWFILLSLAVLAGIVWFLFKWRTKDLQKNQQMLKKEVERQTEKIQGQTEELRQLDSIKTRLYTNITHEFRTPLTVIMGMVDNIRGHDTERKLIKRNSNNLLRLINQLLDLSKLDSGMLKAQNVQGDIIQYLQYLTESFYSMAKEKNINLTFYAETKTLTMDFDESKIQHIVYNLLSNALKFTKEGGKVIMHALQIEQEGQPFLKLKIQDTGVGISAAEIPFIFDRFYQADSSNTHKSGGTGIGLALTKELIEWMDGKIEVESTKGSGTSFTILLPVKREMMVETVTTHKRTVIESEDVPVDNEDIMNQPIVSNGDEKPMLLIIEDNHDVVFYLQTILQETYDIQIARHGQEGIDKAFEFIPDIIISDVMMPEKNGYEVCETLKTDERTSHIPIILLTAKSSVDDKITGLKVGADAYLMKPFHKEELFVRLEKLLELRRALQKHNTSFETPPSVKSAILEQKEPTLDNVFLQKIKQAIEKDMGEISLGVPQLCRAVNLSHTQVFRKLKAITGENPTIYIRKMRLQKALILLKNTELNISEIAYETGFSDPNYFSRAFNEEFGTTPSAIRK